MSNRYNDFHGAVKPTELKNETNPVFATHAQALREQKLAVIPLRPDRKPYVSGYNKWRRPPGAKVVDDWCEKHPFANIGVLPGLSGNGAVVFDCDTVEAADEFEQRFGKSNLRVQTRRGVHLYYARVPFRLPGNLKRLGLDIDIKAGNQIAIAPPSVHESGHIYRLDGCDWSAIDRLNGLDESALKEFLRSHEQAEQEAAHEKCVLRDSQQMREDSRGLELNDALVGYSAEFHGIEDVLAAAQEKNEQYASHPKGRLPHEEVIKRAQDVWDDIKAGKIKPWGGGRRAVVKMAVDEAERINRHGRHAGDAMLLLHKLRAEHSVRCARGETFAIAAAAMSRGKARFMPRKRLEKARAILLKEGLIVKVSNYRNTAAGRRPAQYRLVLTSNIYDGGGAGAGAV
jgi:hypothetical protein